MKRMAGWNCRIVRHVDDGREWHGVHEVFYDDDGRLLYWTKEPVTVSMPGNVGELVGYLDDLRRAMKDPVLDVRDLEARAVKVTKEV